MGKYHTVAQGEYLAKIARAYGFASHQVIWDAAENKELKDKRKSPNILFPGDRVFIPDKETKEESRATEQKHKFELQNEPLKLRLRLLTLDSKPLANQECTLVVENEVKDFVTKNDGMLENDIPAQAAAGKFLDRAKPGAQFSNETTIPLRIGHLDPLDTVPGQIARLNNLGYEAGELPDHPLSPEEERETLQSPEFLSAVEEFQCDQGLKVDGKCGPQTQAKLKELHGC